MDMREWAETNRLRIKIVDGPNFAVDRSMGDRPWEHNAYTVQLSLPTRRTITTPWKQGTGVQGDPDAATVLDSLVSDATTETFEDWCGEYGYDTDSRSARKTWKACRDVRDRLVHFLGGEDVLENLQVNVDRL